MCTFAHPYADSFVSLKLGKSIHSVERSALTRIHIWKKAFIMRFVL